MKNINKYFWDLNTAALKELSVVLPNPAHPQFLRRMVQFLSRCDRPKEVFAVVSREEFIRAWPQIRAYWRAQAQVSEFRDWWQSIYEEMAKMRGSVKMRPPGAPGSKFIKIGALLRRARADKGISQQVLSMATGIPQPEISKIEEGKKNITLKTLFILCRELGINQLDLG